MSVRAAALALALGCASTIAQAAWTPIFEPHYVRIRPGETVTVSVFGAWTSGISLYPFVPWTFASGDPAVASVEGFVPNANERFTLRITGHKPGIAHARITDPPAPVDRNYMVIAVTEREIPVSIGVSGVFRTGRPFTLTAVTSEPEATCTWHWGKLGELAEVGTGCEITYTPTFTANFEYWVLVEAPDGGIGASSIVIQVVDPLPRRRSVRH
jgi:hypothetical protein